MPIFSFLFLNIFQIEMVESYIGHTLNLRMGSTEYVINQGMNAYFVDEERIMDQNAINEYYQERQTVSIM